MPRISAAGRLALPGSTLTAAQSSSFSSVRRLRFVVVGLNLALPRTLANGVPSLVYTVTGASAVKGTLDVGEVNFE